MGRTGGEPKGERRLRCRARQSLIPGSPAGLVTLTRCHAPRITVVGSVNLDLVARCEALPRRGETVSGATLERFPGGKGANQAVACARLGADVRMVAAVGRDAFAAEALAGLREAGVELDLQETDHPTGGRP